MKTSRFEACGPSCWSRSLGIIVVLTFALFGLQEASAIGASGVGAPDQASASEETLGGPLSTEQGDDWDDGAWPVERPAGAPGMVDTLTAPAEGLQRATLERLRAGKTVDLIVEYVAPNLTADADDATVRQAHRLSKQDVLHEAQVFDVEEVEDYSHMPMNVLRVHSLEAVEALRNDPRVKAVHEVGVKYLQLNQSLPLIKQPEAYGLGATGSGATVAVLDTGTDYTRSAFGSCSAPGGACKVVYARDFATDDGSRDDNGHGTNVAGIVLGVAPQAKIAALDVFRGGLAYDTDIIAALNWSIANRSAYNIVAVNLSLGDGQKYTSACSGSSYDSAFSSVRSAGIFIAVASGNDTYTNGISSPACVPGAVSVGAVYDSNVGALYWSKCTDSVTAADKVTCFSNSASFLGLLAPGALIDAAGLQMGGTSQAAPHVAGAVAALKSVCSPATPSDVLSALQTSGKSVTDTRNAVTKPRIDVAAATQRLTSTVNCGGGGTTKPDLIVTTVSSPTTGTAGGTIATTATVKNQGTATAGSFRFGYYLSENNSITTSDIDLAWGCTVSSLAPGATYTCYGSLPLPSTLSAGTYYLGAYADKNGAVAESNESNNGRAASNTIYISSASTARPDLIVTAISSPTTGMAGGSISTATTVKNQGAAAAGAFRLGFYVSTNNVISTGDVYTQWHCDFASLAAGASANCSGSIGLPATLSTGAYYLGAYADNESSVTESNESNNGLAASNTIYIQAASQYDAEDYYRKVNAYFYGTYGRSATSAELAAWGDVLLDNNGSVWLPTGAGLQHYLSNSMGWGTAPLNIVGALLRVDEVFSNLFGSASGIDSRIKNYYIDGLVVGYVKPRGLVNAILNDLAIMPRANGTYGQPSGWTGGTAIRPLLTSAQFASYRARIEGFESLSAEPESPTTSQPSPKP